MYALAEEGPFGRQSARLRHLRSHRLARVAQGPEGPQDAVQCMWATLGQTRALEAR